MAHGRVPDELRQLLVDEDAGRDGKRPQRPREGGAAEQVGIVRPGDDDVAVPPAAQKK